MSLGDVLSYQLHIVDGRKKGRGFSFDQTRVSIGRAPENDLVVYESGVSRRHCEIVQDGKAFVLRDLGSSNGTYVNGLMTTEGHVGDGDVIRLGPISFEMRVEAGAMDGDTQPRITSHQLALAPQTAQQRRMMEEQPTGAMPMLVDGAPRTPTGSFAPLKRSRLANVYRRHKKAVAAGAVACLVGFVGVFIATRAPAPIDRSTDVFHLKPGEIDQRKFGLGRVHIHTADKVQFAFNDEGGRTDLKFAVGGVEEPQEVAILVNDTLLSYAPMSHQ